MARIKTDRMLSTSADTFPVVVRRGRTRKERGMSQQAIQWFDIFVADIERAVRFYETVLDVKLRRATEDDRPMALFASAVEDGVGGALVRQPGREPSAVGALVYLDADGKLDASLARVERAGGSVVMPRTDIGAPGFIALVRDTEGNVVGLHS
ncbi:MAG TPA: VOC family protein [Minicystis sp.]|nr:VOC family protein [Minicystis sp.]